MLAMMRGNAVLVTVLSCCGSGLFFWGRTLRDFGSAFGGRVLVMSEKSISRKCGVVVRCCGIK